MRMRHIRRFIKETENEMTKEHTENEITTHNNNKSQLYMNWDVLLIDINSI